MTYIIIFSLIVGIASGICGGLSTWFKIQSDQGKKEAEKIDSIYKQWHIES